MRHMYTVGFVALLVLLVFAASCTREVTVQETTKVVAPSTAAYVGSAECGSCHADTYASFQETGHPFKLNEAEDVQLASYYPFSSVPSPPAGVAWADVDKVIGGFWWKARFIGHDGYIITGDDVQYNLVDGSFTAYHAGETKPYACGPCHMTAYKDVGNQEGKEGLIGTWEFNGIQCEECHGPGELHAVDPYNVGMVIDYSSEQCGKCHIRGPVEKIPASGGFIRHHEQWNEIFTTKHSTLQCVDCHDPHQGLHPDNPDRELGIKIDCEGCHFEETESFLASSIEHAGSSVGPECIDCHMPRASKSALAAGPYEGDVRTHLFRINTDVNAEMFTEDGAFANGYLTLEYTCLQCHASQDKAWAATYAGSVHASTPAASEYVGSEACESCHASTYANFKNTGHPYKLNPADSAFLPVGEYYPYTTVPLPPDLTADDVSMVIGGFWWKARYIDNDGYVLTGDNRQYNFETDEFVAYSASTAPRKPYACGPCHMTDYKSVGNQGGLEGMVGTWEFNGIQCEECHGPGGSHVEDAFANKMIIDRTSEQCGKCHIRGFVGEIPASGGFVRHHEQWNEMFTTKHAALDCVDCHDPHKGLHPDNPDRAEAIKIQCENCHFGETQSFLATTITEHITDPSGPGCIDCHMPRAAKSAVAVGTYEGDIRSHLWRINTDSTAEMFTGDGSLANGYLTVEYTCLQCHTTEDKAWALMEAANAHNPSVVKEDPESDIIRISSR